MPHQSSQLAAAGQQVRAALEECFGEGQPGTGMPKSYRQAILELTGQFQPAVPEVEVSSRDHLSRAPA